MENGETDLQRKYYAKTASQYDQWHLDSDKEHHLALGFLVGAMDYLHIKSVLDVGSGTGRAVAYIKQKRPDISVIGIEPVKELREIGYRKGLSESDLVGGDANAMVFEDSQFDLVCEFGVLHHIRNHRAAVAEMLRVARKAIFLSDDNKFGRGSWAKRVIKRLINAVGLWSAADFVNTRGKGHHLSEVDGLSYSYSVFDDYKLIREHCNRIHILNTRGEGIGPYGDASHVALLGIKK